MRETPVSNCEKKFVLEYLLQGQRLDGRKMNELRSMILSFGADWGSVHVSIGNTRVLAQVSCELGQSQTTRPNEGILYINVELGPMAAANFEPGRNSELTVRINRILERTFKDSKCVDLESLCVIAEDRVWILRVDINVLNYDGNLVDCCAAACLSALAHFRRPEVTVDGVEVKIHTAAEKDFIPIVLHHYPTCVSYATFNDGKIAVADPSLIEERICDADMVFGINSYKELCCLNLSGKTLTSSELLLQCGRKAAEHVKAAVELIKYEIQCDLDDRQRNDRVGFAECLRQKKLNTVAEEKLSMKIRYFHYRMPYIKREVKMQSDVAENELTDTLDESANIKVEPVDTDTAVVHSNQKQINWLPDSDSEDENDQTGNLGNLSLGDESSERSSVGDMEVAQIKENVEKINKKSNQSEKNVVMSAVKIEDDDSEEEDVVILD